MGGEILGLTRAWMYAGAPSVLASLWKVDDRATQALMAEFYTNLWQKKLGKLDALRQAQLAMVARFDPKSGALRGAGAVTRVVPRTLPEAEPAAPPKGRLSPFYWAAFLVSGDWR